MNGLYISLTLGTVILATLAAFASRVSGIALSDCAFDCFLLIVVIFIFQKIYEKVVG